MAVKEKKPFDTRAIETTSIEDLHRQQNIAVLYTHQPGLLLQQEPLNSTQQSWLVTAGYYNFNHNYGI